jgi:hypothetical protein
VWWWLGWARAQGVVRIGGGEIGEGIMGPLSTAPLLFGEFTVWAWKLTDVRWRRDELYEA